MFYDKLDSICKIKGTSPSAVARKIGMSKSNVTGWKNGQIPSSETVQKISDHLKTDVSYFYDNSELSPEECETIGKNLHAFAMGSGTTVLHMLSKYGLSTRTCREIAEGNYPFNDYTLSQIAAYIDVTPSYLLGNNEEHIQLSKSFIIPDGLKDLALAFHNGGVESLTPDEITKLVQIAKILKKETNNDN